MPFRFCTYFLLLLSFFSISFCKGQLYVNDNITAAQLAEKLTGNGVQVFNVQFTGSIEMAAVFENVLNLTNINIDSGIILTTGRTAAGRGTVGMEGFGGRPANEVLASNPLGLPGDADIARTLGVDIAELHDACVLEFDFIPIGDSISFRYVFSSEEYDPAYVCSFNDAFAFFISGPGITGQKNIALVPGTNTPVSISAVNNVAGVPCNANGRYYFDNTANTYFTHDGHTTVLRAAAPVTSCQVYHLKFVITDATDDRYDSGVFLEAKSLTSKSVRLSAQADIDKDGVPYIAEGCETGKLIIKKPASTDAANIILRCSGTAANGIDYTTIDTTVTMAPGTTELQVDLTAIADNITEGDEELKITALFNCNLGDPALNDSIIIRVKEFKTLAIAPDSTVLCNSQPVQLTAAPGYSQYRWDNTPSLSSTVIPNPVATPTADSTAYYCTAGTGSCRARGSALIIKKAVVVLNEKKLSCAGRSDGSITLSGGWQWERPVSYSFNNGPWGSDSVFNNLTTGNYILQVQDASGCTDTLDFFLGLQYPNMLVNVTSTPASCSGLPDGTAVIQVTGGATPYQYSLNNINFAATDTFHLTAGDYTAYVKDSSGCPAPASSFTMMLVNRLNIQLADSITVCEGDSTPLLLSTAGNQFVWEPVTALSSSTQQNPVAAPTSTTLYHVTASIGTCTGTDSILVLVKKAPVANAGIDTAVCNASTARLHTAGNFSYNWQPAELLDDNTLAHPLTDTLFTDTYFLLQVTDSVGCRSVTPDSVKVTVKSNAKIYLGNDTSIAVNQPLQLTATDVNNSGFIFFNWQPVTGLSHPHDAATTAVLDKDSITYTVHAETAEGCVSNDTVKIKTYIGPAIYVAAAFTPNNSGLNDILHITAAGFKKLQYFTIYNRWGQVVFSTSNAATGWDGTYKGQKAAAGTYVWIAAGTTYRGMLMQRRGTVLLIR